MDLWGSDASSHHDNFCDTHIYPPLFFSYFLCYHLFLYLVRYRNILFLGFIFH